MRAASARRRALIARLAALALLCLGLAVSGCGADDEPAAKPAKPPELTIPETDAPTTTETTETTETAPAPTTTEPAAPTETLSLIHI